MRTSFCCAPDDSYLTLSLSRSAILNANRGYRISISHTVATAIKTDAPASFLWDILRYTYAFITRNILFQGLNINIDMVVVSFVRGWNKLHPVRPPPPGSVAAAILEKEPSFEADFTEREDAKVRIDTPTFVWTQATTVHSSIHSLTFRLQQPEKSKKPRFVHNPPNWGPGTRRQINVKRWVVTSSSSFSSSVPYVLSSSSSAYSSSPPPPPWKISRAAPEAETTKEGEEEAQAEKETAQPQAKKKRQDSEETAQP